MNRPLLSCFLSVLLVGQSLAGQQAAPAAGSGAPGALKITVLEGEGAMNNVGQRTPRTLSVQVDDEKNQPVNQASVTFTLPHDGPSGLFSNNSTTTTVTTDAQGKATVRGFRPNTAPGKIEILVSASANGKTARATITQFNMAVTAAPPKPKNTGKIIAIIAVAGAAAAAGAFVATRQGGTAGPPDSSRLPTLTVGVGTGTVGPPQ